VKTSGRTDLEDFWRLSGVCEDSRWPHHPALAFTNDEVKICTKPQDLLLLPDDTPVMKQWAGRWSSDFFQFTVGDFKKAKRECS